MLAFYKKENKF